MFICVPDSTESSVTYVSPGHWRVQAIVIESDNSQTFLINSYVSFYKIEASLHDNNDEDDLNETIGVISNLIRTVDCGMEKLTVTSAEIHSTPNQLGKG